MFPAIMLCLFDFIGISVFSIFHIIYTVSNFFHKLTCQKNKTNVKSTFQNKTNPFAIPLIPLISNNKMKTHPCTFAC